MLPGIALRRRGDLLQRADRDHAADRVAPSRTEIDNPPSPQTLMRENGSRQTASFAAFTGRTLSILRAGFALKTVGSLVNGLMPVRSLVAGFLMTMNLAKPGSRNSPLFFISL